MPITMQGFHWLETINMSFALFCHGRSEWTYTVLALRGRYYNLKSYPFLQMTKDSGMGCALSYTFEINKLNILRVFYVKMNHFEVHLMISSRVVDSKGHSV